MNPIARECESEWLEADGLGTGHSRTSQLQMRELRCGSRMKT